jgi:hypothetical protein
MANAIDTLPKIKVYRESEEWAKYEKWWMMPGYQLRKLYITTWDRHVDQDGHPIHSDEDDAAFVRSRYDHPVVLVY